MAKKLSGYCLKSGNGGNQGHIYRTEREVMGVLFGLLAWLSQREGGWS